MIRNKLILAKDCYYDLDTYKTRLNNNVLVVGTSGSGKTRGVVAPNILQATGSYIVSDPKGNLHDKYGDYLRNKGYRVLKLNFVNPLDSDHYNFFDYIHSQMDVVKIAHTLTYYDGNQYRGDPFWPEAVRMLFTALIGYLYEHRPKSERTLQNVLKLANACMINEDDHGEQNALDALMAEIEHSYPDSFSAEQYKMFRIAAGRTLRSILVSLNSKTSAFNTKELKSMMAYDTIDISSIGREKTALFVVVSDTDRSMDGLANIFFTQAMNELCRFADMKCEDQRLPVDVQFILDDFATNVRIDEFPRMISSIRSRGISALLMIQAESQLSAAYGDDGRTIISNCDSYVYLGGNDIETTKNIAYRCDVPLKRILYMPVGKCWIFRRGQDPVYADNFELEPYINEIMGNKDSDIYKNYDIVI